VQIIFKRFPCPIEKGFAAHAAQSLFPLFLFDPAKLILNNFDYVWWLLVF